MIFSIVLSSCHLYHISCFLFAVLCHNARKGMGNIQLLHNLLHRGMVIPHMADVEIDIIHAKIFKALIQVIFNVLLPADPGINFFLCTRGKLCGNHIFITLCKIPERFPNKLLTGSILIGNRRIIKIDAKLQTMLYNFPCPAFCMLRRSAGSSIQCINPKSI